MKKQTIAGLFLLLGLIGLFHSCTMEKTKQVPTQAQQTPGEELQAPLAPSSAAYSAWAVYWDFSNLKQELEAIKPHLESISFFEVFYDDKGAFILPDELEEMRNILKSMEFPETFKTYLTFVNDFMLPDGSISNKDISRTQTFWDTVNDAQIHAEEIVALTKSLGYDGVEMDYEALGEAEEIWDSYLLLLEILQQKCEEQGLLLKVVLEPKAPFHKDFPAGIEYTIMCYNLYGGHSGPGPKATPAFINEVIDRTDHFSEDLSFALATGGFDWGSDKTFSLTQKAAEDLSVEYEVMPERDNESGCMVFDYTDEDNVQHTVWYADAYTLQHWASVVKKASPKSTIAIWRLNGNTDLGFLGTE